MLNRPANFFISLASAKNLKFLVQSRIESRPLSAEVIAMRILSKGFTRYELLRKLLFPVATQLQFAVIFPLATLVVVCYPFLSSMLQQSQSHILLHDAHIQPNSSVLHIRQAVVVPPIFVSALDQEILRIVEPLRELSATLEHSHGPQLYSLFNPQTPDVSMYVAPDSHNPQGLLFSFAYSDEADAELWENALRVMCDGPLPVAPSNLVDRKECKEAQLSTASSAFYSLWPGASMFSEISAWLCTISLLAWTLGSVYSAGLHRPNVIVCTIVVRIVLCSFASLSVISILFPAFDMLLVYRFAAVALVPLHIGTSSAARVICAAQSTSSTSPTAFNRLLNAFNNSFSWTNTFGVPAILSVMCIIWGVNSQRSLVPLTALVATYSLVDTYVHYTLFAAVLYIDIVSSEHHDFLSLERTDAKGGIFRRIQESSFLCFIQAVATNLHFEVLLPVLSALILHVYGYDFINRIHPHIKNTLEQPEYIQIFVDPLSNLLQDYAVLEVFRPAVFQVNGYFSKPTASLSLTLATLRYGNTLSLILETFCLLIFVSSVCMIALILLTDRDHLNLNIQAFLFNHRREQFAEWTIDVGAGLDIVKLDAQNNYVASLSLDGQFSVVDASVKCTSPLSSLSLLNIPNPWGVRKILLNTSKGMAGLLYGHSAHMWDMQTSQKIYEFSFEHLTDAVVKHSLWNGRDLILVLEQGKIIEVYTDKPPKVLDLYPKQIAWASDCDAESVIVCCTIDDELFVALRKSPANWSIHEVLIGEAFLAVPGRPVPSTIPSVRSGHVSQQSIPWTLPFEGNDRILGAISIPDIKLKLVITDRRAFLVEMNTSIIIRYLPQINFKPGTLKVFHSPPQHCVFCGSIALTSFTVAYEQLDVPGMLICETYQVQNKSRSKICLRIERGPNETRCHGFMAANGTRHSILNVKCWATTGINMIIGARLNCEDAVEGFTYSSNGLVSSFHIDEQIHEGQLLTGVLGPTAQLTATSVCVAFGNVIKVFYQLET